MSRYLLRHLSNLIRDDPFLIPNSDEVIQFLQQDSSTVVRYGFSLDVEDLFYSIPHSKIFAAVKECIETKGITSFRNERGISAESFLDLLRFYLSATVVMFEGRTQIQKKGICIGSCMAPVLCDIFLSHCDREIGNEKTQRPSLPHFSVRERLPGTPYATSGR